LGPNAAPINGVYRPVAGKLVYRNGGADTGLSILRCCLTD